LEDGIVIDQKAIEEHIRGILVALGDDPEREGLKDTPKRVAKMYAEVFAGMNYSNHEIAEMFDKTFEEGIADEEDHVSLTIPEDDSERADLTAVVGKNGPMVSASSPEDSKPARVVVMKDIDFFSYCEHHMALMYDMKACVAYVPNGKVIGLSKIARVCDMVGRRLQLQEKIGKDIADIISEITGSKDVAVTIEGHHSCVSARGIKKQNTKTFTAELRGRFRTDAELQFHLR
jgi:GTP cyclohydrolase I